MRYLLAIALLCVAAVTDAAPFLACDVDVRTTHTALQFCTSINAATSPATCSAWGAWGADTPTNVVSTTAEECKNDLSSAPTGFNLVRTKAIDINSAWTGGREESAPSAPFAFTRPAPLQSPTGSRLVP